MRVIDRAFKLFEVLIVLCLVAMVVMVFGNAALRKLSDYGLVLFGGEGEVHCPTSSPRAGPGPRSR